MLSSPYQVLIVLALIFTVCSFVWQNYPLLSVAVLLICIALFTR